jgi:hypothetical protein
MVRATSIQIDRDILEVDLETSRELGEPGVRPVRLDLV